MDEKECSRTPACPDCLILAKWLVPLSGILLSLILLAGAWGWRTQEYINDLKNESAVEKATAILREDVRRSEATESAEIRRNAGLWKEMLDLREENQKLRSKLDF